MSPGFLFASLLVTYVAAAAGGPDGSTPAASGATPPGASEVPPASGANCTLAALSVGPRLNSSKDLARLTKRHDLLLVGFSAESCANCCVWEPMYREAQPALQARGVHWARVDVDRVEAKSLAAAHDVEALPALVLFHHGRRPLRLLEEQSIGSLLALVDRALQPLPRASGSSSAWDAWRRPSALFGPPGAGRGQEADDADVAMGLLLRVAALLDEEAAEEDLEELTEAARSLAGRPLSVRFTRASEAGLRQLFSQHPLVSAACGGAAKAAAGARWRPLLVALALFDGEYLEPSRLRAWGGAAAEGHGVRMSAPRASRGGAVFSRARAGTGPAPASGEAEDVEVLPRVACRPLDAYDGISIEQWALRTALPPVGRFDAATSGLYEKTRKPIVMLFADTQRQELPLWLRLLHEAQRKYNRPSLEEGTDEWRLLFTYVDGQQFLHRMTSLGLAADLGRLPALCVNFVTEQFLTWQPPREAYTNHSAQLTAEVLDSLVQRYLRGDGSRKAEPQAPRALPVPKRDAKAGQRRQVPNLDDLSLAERLRFVPAVNQESFAEVVFDASKDVLVYFFASKGPAMEASKASAIYVNRCAERFEELGSPTVRVVRLDSAEFSAPATVQISGVPSLVLFPAFSKDPPHKVYRGKMKAQHIMWWVQEHASRPFKLPELPHLDELEAQAYWQQKAELPPERQLHVARQNEGSVQPRRRRRSRRRAKGEEL